MELQHRTDPIGNQPDLNQIRGSFFSWAIGEGRRSRPSSVANPKIESDFGRILASMIPAQNPTCLVTTPEGGARIIGRRPKQATLLPNTR
jgi:hypothetical protein